MPFFSSSFNLISGRSQLMFQKNLVFPLFFDYNITLVRTVFLHILPYSGRGSSFQYQKRIIYKRTKKWNSSKNISPANRP